MLIESLKQTLAETFSLYLKSHYYHWNVEGPDFYQYHEFFSDFYKEVFDSIDIIAEQIRALNSYTPGSFERFTELSKIKGEDRIIPANQMITQLKQDNEYYIQVLTQTYYEAEKANELGLSNFIQDRIDRHKKHAWMLRSFLKGTTNG